MCGIYLDKTSHAAPSGWKAFKLSLQTALENKFTPFLFLYSSLVGNLKTGANLCKEAHQEKIGILIY